MMYYYQEVEFLGKTKKIIGRTDPDGLIWWLAENENDPYYIEWISKGNEPEEWNPEELNGSE